MGSFPFAGAPDPDKSAVRRIARAENERQWRQLIMIPSESICHPEAAAILSCDLGGIYAEGLPEPLLLHDARDAAADAARFQSWQTRLSDRRFYKGTVNANRAELAAQAMIAAVFARLPGSPSARDIRVNVQPLSGAAANLAVYEALLNPGDCLMGLDLAHGGHLTHGSEFNFSGKTYKVRSYRIDESTRKLDYERIRADALESRPRIIIGGASAYPWDFDWAALRRIADEVGAYLLADVAHLAGMVAAGLLNNPLPHAHATTFTTHKTLCGPRGAVIITTDPSLAQRIDMALFPGMQGGPHMNSIAAIARLFELIGEDYNGFRGFQRAVLANAQFMAECFEREGFTLEYRGTETHMLLLDLKPFRVAGGIPLDGEIASRLLEIAGVVCNKNVIPGDPDAAHSSGLRFGMPWLTQRGVTRDQIAEIAKIVRSVLEPVQTLAVCSPMGEDKCRGRVPPDVLDQAARRTLAIAESLPYPPRPKGRSSAPPRSAVGGRALLLLRGDKVRLALLQMLSARLPVDGSPVRARMLHADGSEIDDVIAVALDPVGREERWLLLPHTERADTVRRWIEDLSDGYLLFDGSDLQQKIDGPTVVEEPDASALPAALLARLKGFAGEAVADLTKPYFIGQRTIYADAHLPSKGDYRPSISEVPLRQTVLNAIHRELGAKMAPFAGWEMPINYPADILAEHRAVRAAAGLFDISHMSALEVSGPHSLAFLDSLLANCVSRLDPGEAQYSCALDPDGKALDDLYVYRLERERYMLVVNAANAERVKDWISAVNSRRFVIDREMPAKQTDGPVAFRDLRDAGADSLIVLSMQGRVSLRILEALAEDAAHRAAMRLLTANSFARVTLAGAPAIVARTGYTGEEVGFEIFLHPRKAEEFWRAASRVGGPIGLLPAGLGARDSTRVEAGFPLFGHELEGELGISIAEAGYAYVPRFHVPFFIGRRPMMRRIEGDQRRILRLQGQGRKTIRAGHVILDEAGNAVGQATSFTYVHDDMTFVVLACVDESFNPPPGQVIRAARIGAAEYAGRAEERSIVELAVLPRFPTPDERVAWPTRYSTA